ncbi:MAG TPA: oxidoreductase [Acidimicrobiia bacterium]|jgi:NAD(P)-dependent dehydrogenase (short-subunit alcohol dehydrogenase family)
MPWSTQNIPDLDGRTAAVTGANGGLGYATAKALAGAGAHVVIAARHQPKARAAHDHIMSAHPDASIEIVELDLGSLASVERAAKTIASAHPQLDILVNNAGLMALPERRTEDGFEMQFGVNHLGHWAFTSHLLANLLSAEAARVVNVTSVAHHTLAKLDPDNPHLEGEYDPWKAYGQSKLANYHFTLGLQREFERHGARAISLMAHPGLTNSDLQARTVREGGPGGRWESIAGRIGMSVEDGALPQLRAATDPAAAGGQMYAPRFLMVGPPVRRPVLRVAGLDQAIADLWLVSERETGLTLDIGRVMEQT